MTRILNLLAAKSKKGRHQQCIKWAPCRGSCPDPGRARQEPVTDDPGRRRGNWEPSEYIFSCISRAQREYKEKGEPVIPALHIYIIVNESSESVGINIYIMNPSNIVRKIRMLHSGSSNPLSCVFCRRLPVLIGERMK